jgi:hypothetical protein
VLPGVTEGLADRVGHLVDREVPGEGATQCRLMPSDEGGEFLLRLRARHRSLLRMKPSDGPIAPHVPVGVWVRGR